MTHSRPQSSLRPIVPGSCCQNADVIVSHTVPECGLNSATSLALENDSIGASFAVPGSNINQPTSSAQENASTGASDTIPALDHISTYKLSARGELRPLDSSMSSSPTPCSTM